LSRKKPRPTDESGSIGGTGKGVNILSVISFESTRLDLPRSESWTSTANFARSVGVVQSPAGAISG
jgi:hypothetical protein